MKDICVRLDDADCTDICTDSVFGHDENSEFIIFNLKKENVQKIEVIFKSKNGRSQIAIGDLQIFYTDSDTASFTTTPSCVDPKNPQDEFDEDNIKVLSF